MAISVVGSAVGTTTATIPTHQAGDFLLAFAYRSGSTTNPTVPGGWTSIDGGGANTNAAIGGWQVATGPGTTSGTWTNASRLIVVVLRSNTGTLGIGGIGSGGNTGTTLTIPAVTLEKAGGNRVVAFGGHRTSTNLATPSGLTDAVSTAGNPIAEAWESGGTVATFAAVTSAAGASSGWRALSVEVVELNPQVRVYQALHSGTEYVNPLRTGSATGSFAYAGAAAGKRAPKATGVGTFAYAGVATGTAPALATRTGAASGSFAFTGTAAGARPALAQVRIYRATFAGTAFTQTWAGAATGSWGYTGQAIGRTPSTPTKPVPVSWGGTGPYAGSYTGDFVYNLGLGNPAAGDYIFVVGIVRPTTADLPDTMPVNVGPPLPLLGETTGGTGTFGLDAGPTRIAVWGREAIGGETTMNVPVMAGSGFTTATLADIFYGFYATKPTDATWAPAVTFGVDATHDTTWLATGSTNLALEAGDLLVTVTGVDTDTASWQGAGATNYQLSATGATLGITTSRAEVPSIVGNDSRMTVRTTPVTAGTSTAAPVHTGTLNAAACGVTAFIRARALSVGVATGAASGGWSFTGAASGRTTKRGTATGAWAYAGAATGVRPVVPVKQGTASGSWTYSGAAVGRTTRRGAATGSFAYAGAAAGAAPAVGMSAGVAAGSWLFAGTATGKRAPKGSAVGAWSLSGAAVGSRPSTTTATVRIYRATFLGIEYVIPEGAATGTLTYTGSATGRRPNYSGEATGSRTYAGSATGVGTNPADTYTDVYPGTPAGTRTGTATGSRTYTGTAVGRRVPKGTVSSTWGYTGTAAGKRVAKGAATGTRTYSGTSVGTRPAVGSRNGSAAGAWAYVGTAVGKRTAKATAAGAYAYAGEATGVRPALVVSTGTADGAWGYAGASVGRAPTPLDGRLDLTVTIGPSRTFYAADLTRSRAQATPAASRVGTATVAPSVNQR